jgi:hypothetical protein
MLLQHSCLINQRHQAAHKLQVGNQWPASLRTKLMFWGSHVRILGRQEDEASPCMTHPRQDIALAPTELFRTFRCRDSRHFLRKTLAQSAQQQLLLHTPDPGGSRRTPVDEPTMATAEETRILRTAPSTSDLPEQARDVTKPGAVQARTKPMKLTEAMGNAPYLWNPVFNRGQAPPLFADVALMRFIHISAARS